MPTPSRLALSFTLALGAATAGCDGNGLYPLGELRDTLVPCTGASTTYLRSTSDATEVLVIGSTSPTTEVVPVETPRCFVYGSIGHKTSSHLETGVYSRAANGTGQFIHAYEYDFTYEPSTAIISRKGSQRTQLTPAAIQPLQLQNSGTDLIVTIDGNAMRFKPIGEVADRIDINTQSGAEDAFRLVNLAIFTGNVRLIAFGGGGMTQYVGSAGRFLGIIANEFTVQVDSLTSPHTNIIYYQFQDLTGIVLDGVQTTLVNIGGNGPMTGTVAFVVQGAGGPFDIAFRGGIVYDNIGISNGNASSGTFGMNFSVGSGTVSYSLPVSFATDLDLRRVLPEQAP